MKRCQISRQVWRSSLYFMLYNQAIKYNLSTITIVSGAPRFNKLASRIMDTLKAASEKPITFLGVVGD